jgi:RHS repeat-associated protein
MQARTSIRVLDSSMTRPLACLLSEASARSSISTGKERDAESGNDYFGARYYSSSMGRFMSPDWSAKTSPVPYATFGDPQSLNLYSYVRNNPLSKADADGHCDWCWNAITTVAVWVGTHPALAQAVQSLGDSMGMKGQVGGFARFKEGNTNVGGSLSVTSEGRNDGSGKSAIQLQGAAQIAGVGPQFNKTGTFEKDGQMVNPLANTGGSTKLSETSPVGSQVQVGDDGRVAAGASLNVGIPSSVPGVEFGAQVSVQVTGGAQEAAGVAQEAGNAAISDGKQYVQDLKTSGTCGPGGCTRPQ